MRDWMDVLDNPQYTLTNNTKNKTAYISKTKQNNTTATHLLSYFLSSLSYFSLLICCNCIKLLSIYFPYFSRIKMRADQLEAWELEKLRNSTQQGMYSKEAQFRRRQTNELLALQKRIQAGRDEQKKLRQRDLECLLQRYQNVKSELETAQNLERIRMDRYAGQTAATMGIVGNKAKRAKEAARRG